MTTTNLPPWLAMVQLAADQAELDLATRAVAKDIADAAYENVIGPRPERHRKDTPWTK